MVLSRKLSYDKCGAKNTQYKSYSDFFIETLLKKKNFDFFQAISNFAKQQNHLEFLILIIFKKNMLFFFLINFFN